ncbi:MAG: phosphotransferase [Bacteroidales bacterium]|nr:phosphotransferase [Bacteroidales bacterium]
MEELNETSISVLTQMVTDYTGKQPITCAALAQSGSHRRYYRFTFEEGNTLIGTYNEDVTENKAFFEYTRFFAAQQLNVPALLAVHEDQKHYLLNDLGTQTLYDKLCETKKENGDFQKVMDYYKKVVAALPKFQLTAKKGLDMSVAYPRAAFDRQSMQWDLNYFKYYYLKMVYVPFNEQLLEDDFQRFMDYLLSIDDDYFLYRDFQSRNIMVNQDDVWFIDYQGGRKGALQYDIASLLYDAKADLSPEIRQELLECYMDNLAQYIPIDRKRFTADFNAFALIRIMQAMGAYGYRGYFEKKAHFLQSVPYAIRNMRYLLQHNALPANLPELRHVLQTVVDSYVEPVKEESDILTVTVQSFSYKKGIPEDNSGNGGGFVFDCRALPNPGREKRYATFTGKDDCVIEYLQQYKEVETFVNHVCALVDMSVDNYLERRFTHLTVNFGCTGGQHRSVYFAEQTAAHLREKYPQIVVELRHREQ